MANHTIDLTKSVDPITEKFDDNEAMQRLVQRAASEAVDKANVLGLLPPPGIQEETAPYLINSIRSSSQDTD